MIFSNFCPHIVFITNEKQKSSTVQKLLELENILLISVVTSMGRGDLVVLRKMSIFLPEVEEQVSNKSPFRNYWLSFVGF